MRLKRTNRIRLPSTASDDEGEPCVGAVSQIKIWTAPQKRKELTVTCQLIYLYQITCLQRP